MPTLAFTLPVGDMVPEASLTVSQWADQHRVLSEKAGSAEPGAWRTERTPYLREIMDSFADPYVEEITMKKSTQVGGTEVILNCIGYIIDTDPGPTMLVYARDEDARIQGTKRVKPMITDSPALSVHTTGKEDDVAGKLFEFDRMFLKFAGANSPADLASDPVRYLFFDEVNKYPKFSGRESDPIKLGTERTRTFWNRKIFKASTPTVSSGYVSRDYERSDKRRYYVPCPHCGAYQPLVFRREDGAGRGEVRWPQNKTPDEILEHRLAWYECGFCAERIEEGQKPVMLERGVWCPEGCIVNKAGKLVGEIPTRRHRGYHISALYSPWVAWSQVAKEFLECKDEAPALMNFINSVLAEDWIERTQQTKEGHLRTRVWTHAMGEVPPGVAVLTAGVDVQEDHYWYVIRGWGIGEESWLIRYGRVETEVELLHALIQTQYPSAEGLMSVRLACVDTAFKTSDVYQLIRKHRERLRAIKGYEHILAAPYRVTLIDKDSKGKPLAGGLSLWTIDTNYYKDKLSRLIHTIPGSSGEWHLCQDVIQDPAETYLKQMTAEQKVIVRNRETGGIKEVWQPVSEHRANHLWDCEVYALAAADMLKVWMLRPPGKATVFQPAAGPNKPGFITGWKK